MTKIRKEQIGSGTATSGQVLTADGSGGAAWADASGGASVFTDLTDVPAAYTGDGGKYVKVNATEDGLEFDTPAGSGDMTKAVYDTNDDGSVDKADAIDGIAAAGNSKYYGTDSSGTAGFHDLPAGGSGAVATDTIWDAKGDLVGGTGANTAQKLTVGTDGQVLTAASGETTGLKWATPLASEGEGHITVFAMSYNAIGQGTMSLTRNASCLYDWYLNTTAANANNGDNVSYKVYLAPGTYTFLYYYHKNTDAGIIDVTVDDTEIGSFDCYGSLTWNVRGLVTGISITTGGLKTITFTVDGKNASSADYKFYLVYFAFWRTA